MYWTSNRIGMGEDAARKSRLGSRVSGQYFHIWHCTKSFLVPTSEKTRFYPTLPTDCVDPEAPKDVWVPTQTILAYSGRRWIAASRDLPALAQERSFLCNVLLFEWSLLGLLCHLHAAYYGLGFRTTCRDGRFYSRRERPLGTRKFLFSLSSRLAYLIPSPGMEGVFR